MMVNSTQKKRKNDVIYCEYCSKIFTQRKNLYRHIRNLHPDKDFKMKRMPAQRKRKEDVENCEYCPQIFSQRRNLYRHIRNSHPGKDFVMKRKSSQKRLRNNFQSSITNQNSTDASVQQTPITNQNSTDTSVQQLPITDQNSTDASVQQSDQPGLCNDWGVIHVKRFQAEKKRETFCVFPDFNPDSQNKASEFTHLVNTNVHHYRRSNYHTHYNVIISVFNDKDEEMIITMNDCCGEARQMSFDLFKFQIKLEKILKEYTKLNAIHIDLEEKYMYEVSSTKYKPSLGRRYRKDEDIREYDEIGFRNM